MAKRIKFIGVIGLNILAFIVFVGAYLVIIRPWHRSWGATAEEIKSVMPADSLVPNPNFVTTRAETIDSRPEDIWPWLVQMGYKRGGLYSYDWIDRLQKILDRPSANVLLPEFQGLKAGDEIPIGGGSGWPVSSLEPNRSLVFDIRQPGVHITWSWLLAPLEDGATRLIVRIKGRIDVKAQAAPIIALLDPGEFAMVRKMLTGIKRRVEGAAGTPAEELIELLLWCAAILIGLVSFIGALVKKSWIPLFVVTWAAWGVLFYLVLGQPSLVVGILFILVLCASMVWAFFRRDSGAGE